MRLGAALMMCCLAILLAPLPAASAQSAALFFPATGHFLTDDTGFLSFWREHDGARLLGFPVAEAASVEGRTVQFFERGRLEYLVDQDSGVGRVQPGQVGVEYAEELWRSFPPAPPRKPGAGRLVFEETGHTLRAPFLAFWQDHGGQDWFGAPISEALWELTERGQRQVQYFERARLERDPKQAGTPDEIVVGDLGRALAMLQGVDTAPRSNWGAETYGPPPPLAPNVVSLDLPPPTPVPPLAPQQAAAPAARPAAPARPAANLRRAAVDGKLIVVNLSDQWLYAFEGKQQVFDAPVSTGRDGMNTPAGTFSVYTKLKKQTMDGVDNGVPWVVPNVPNVMYIHGGVAIHGTYWHNKFGTGARMSHGCINMPLKAAAWLYDWAPVGTAVKVTY